MQAFDSDVFAVRFDVPAQNFCCYSMLCQQIADQGCHYVELTVLKAGQAIRLAAFTTCNQCQAHAVSLELGGVELTPMERIVLMT